jgi:hypothetical protein
MSYQQEVTFSRVRLQTILRTFDRTLRLMFRSELSIFYMQNLLMQIFALAKVRGNPVEQTAKQNILLWLHTDLKQRGLVHDNRKAKPILVPTDITTLLRSFFQVQYLTATHNATRAALNVVLALGLMIDCNGRVSELIDSEEVPVALRAAHLEQNEEKVFSWKRVEIFAFSDENQQGSPMKLQARLTFKNLKQASKKSEKRMKCIPLRLLPLEFAAEDTLRWLLILALMDGVLDGISKWADLDGVRPSPNGVKIPIKEEFLDTPVSWPLLLSAFP